MVKDTGAVSSKARAQRLETEEEITREVFEALWPPTEGRRISKRRRKIEEGRLTWEIDEFDGRDLVLAEVEIPAQDVTTNIPGWLQPLVVREVTDDPAHLNHNLALTKAASVALPTELGHEGSRTESGAPESAEDASTPSTSS